MPDIPRLGTLNSTLLVVDVQEKLLAVMPDAIGLVRDVGFLLDVAILLNIPVRMTEQYPQGLGPTHPDLARRLPLNDARRSRLVVAAAPPLAELRESGRPNIVVTGMESHVCVATNGLDLLADGLNVFVVTDTIQSRFQIDHDVRCSEWNELRDSSPPQNDRLRVARRRDHLRSSNR